MLFANKIRQLREDKGLLQRHVSAALDMDNAMYCKIERGDRRAKREQIFMIAEIIQADLNELLVLWLADKIIDALGDERELADEALRVVIKQIKS